MTQKTDGVITHLEPDILECTVKWACPQFVVINTVKGFDTVNKAEEDVFELWYCRRLLRVLWTARRSNQSILKEINPEYSLEGLMLKLKFQYVGHLMQRADSCKRP